MGLFNKNNIDATKVAKNAADKSKLKDIYLKTPGDILLDIYKTTSGTHEVRTREFDIFYKIIGFKGIRDGLGVSTLVANTAIALAKFGLTVCVIDTSILRPSQDILLKTDVRDKREKKDKKNKDNNTDKILDWFDMPFTKRSVLNTSGYNNKINVLSFTDRTLLDLIGLNDSATLVDVALEKVESTYDIILIDICSEPSAVGNACMLKANQIYQVWGNSPQDLASIQSAVTDNLICSVPIDKMKYIITSMTVDDISTPWEDLYKQFKFRELAHVGMSLDIARLICLGKSPYDYVSDSEDIEEFNDCINNICANILGVDIEKKVTGSFTANDVDEGKVKGTVNKKLKDENEKKRKIVEEDTNKAMEEMDIFSEGGNK